MMCTFTLIFKVPPWLGGGLAEDIAELEDTQKREVDTKKVRGLSNIGVGAIFGRGGGEDFLGARRGPE